MNLTEKQVDSFYAKIYIAGDLQTIKQVCRKYCMEVGLCVTVEPVDFIYTGGEESGVVIGLINYARFPSTEGEVYSKAKTLGGILVEECYQKSFSIVTTSKTVYFETEFKKT